MQYQYKPYNAQCPVCTHTANKLLYTVNARQSANHFIQTMGAKEISLDTLAQKIDSLWGKNTASVISCSNCDFVFADPFVAGDAEFYNLLPHSTTANDTNWKWEFEKSFQCISQLAASDANLQLLEIGASTGGFAKRIAKLIKKENIICLEHSAFGVNAIKQAGITAHSWDVRDLNQKGEYANKFNMVCLFQVLEHMDDLDTIFKTFNWVLKPNGRVFIGVPNADKIKFNELNNALLDMPPNHIGRYSDKTFKFLAGKWGFNITETAIEPYTPLDVMKTVMYYQSLQRRQLPPVANTLWYRVNEYIRIKYLRLQAALWHKKLGETLWLQLTKAA
ncbi:class I SAM-dependent methyltransferase [Mucilaginibacter antarcticus]|uniref:Class I SAM-dependent methyltransferase n=1 Tax=Mucilaginibacter antarcticus TaxID=1855725 RepID=A0ABW5XPP2_9SPHI